VGFTCVAALLLVAAPATAQIGACWVVEDDWLDSPTQGAGVCIDGAPKAACNVLAATAVGIEIHFDKGKTCEEVADGFEWEEWDGRCVWYDDTLGQNLCGSIGVEPVGGGITVVEFCEADGVELEGEWIDDGLCPVTTAIPVPAVPGPGLLTLALLLIIGGLLIAWRMRSVATS